MMPTGDEMFRLLKALDLAYQCEMIIVSELVAIFIQFLRLFSLINQIISNISNFFAVLSSNYTR